MIVKAEYIKHVLKFNQAGGTSRGVLYAKPSYYIRLWDAEGHCGIGECSIIPGLSYDDKPELEALVEEVCSHIQDYAEDYNESLKDWPALRFAIEMAIRDLNNHHSFELFPSAFTCGEKAIAINGLIWMGSVDEMCQRIDQKLKDGFTCLKLKIGALDFDKELSILENIRQRYSAETLELRVDANGAFSPDEALSKLDILAKYQLHSIEQPIKAGQVKQMRDLCLQTSLPIALDEELIGIHQVEDKRTLLSAIQPQYIILKPSLVGGWQASNEWIDEAEALNINWWATSALESNIGLNAIAQWVYERGRQMRQGLGTGQVFSNNVQSPLSLNGEQLYYNPNGKWGNPFEVER